MFKRIVMFSVLAAALSSGAPSTRAADNDEGPGDGTGASCRYCKYSVLSQQYSCPTSQFTGKQGQCETWWHMGVHNCKDPAGQWCVAGKPLPPPVIF